MKFKMGSGAKLSFIFLILFGLAFQGVSQTENSIRIDSVSVISSTGHVIIGWTLQTAETQGFIEINRQLPDQTYGLLNTLNNLSISNYTDNSVNANTQSFSYFVAAFDAGGGTLAPSLAHRTIFLIQPEADFCSGRVTLGWYNYQVTTTTGETQQQPVPFDNIRIQISTDGVNFQTLSTQPQPEISTDIQEYSVSGLSPGQYFFRIQSYSSVTGHTSTSNVGSFGFNPPEITDLAIDYVDIFENTEARISFSASGQTSVFNYELHRSAQANQVYEFVGFSPVVSTFSDDPEINQGPWFYRVKAFLKDWECELPAIESEGPFSSIFLQAQVQAKPNEILLKWEHHIPAGRSFSYELMALPFDGQWQTVPSFFDGGQGEFLHNIAPGELVGPVVYKIVATDISDPGISISSNYAFVTVEPVVFIPNAFRPTSDQPLNRVFKPVFPGIDPEQYELQIFNRWGQPVFSSTNAEQGWDGKIDNRDANPGVYSYLLRYTVSGGQKFEKRGVVTLVF